MKQLADIPAPSREHQEVIRNLLVFLWREDAYKHYNVVPEAALTDDRNSAIPDIQIIDKKEEQTEVIIEISFGTGVKADREKVKQLVQQYNIQEGFVYDYKKKAWYRYYLNERGGVSEDKESPEYSDVLDVDLSEGVEL
jgi:Uma2 family endonuclease